MNGDVVVVVVARWKHGLGHSKDLLYNGEVVVEQACLAQLKSGPVGELWGSVCQHFTKDWG